MTVCATSGSVASRVIDTRWNRDALRVGEAALLHQNAFGALDQLAVGKVLLGRVGTAAVAFELLEHGNGRHCG